jgi:16S rRNA (adenine1518-N6/adenine1519-N6)-dimethyltransferase
MQKDDSSLKQMILERMYELNIQPKKSLGQNFLINEYVVSEIFKCVKELAPEFIIEVGPGLGVLTENLIEKKWPRQLIEMDSVIFQYWKQRGEPVIEADALKWEWQNWQGPTNSLLLSNLPYQIGARLVIELSSGPNSIQNMVLMLQKEVTDRLLAKPKTKDYSFLSVVVQTFWEVFKIVEASSHDFYPSPKVDSRVVRLKRKSVDSRLSKDYIQFVKSSFQFRRKFMWKSFAKDKELILQALEKQGYSSKVRAEEIRVEDFQIIYFDYSRQRN